MNYENIASQIIDKVGGKSNIIAVVHCATRLRFTLQDKELRDEEAISNIESVKGTFYVNGQFQVILGSGLVNIICNEINQQLGEREVVMPTASKEETSFLQRAVKLLSDIFVPIIPAIVAGGLLMGINNVLTAPFFNEQSIIMLYPNFADLASMINVFASAAFTFLPVLIGFSATKKFGGNPYLGAAMGMIMVHPELLNAYAVGNTASADIPFWNLFGFHVDAVGYQGTVLPVLAVSWILAKIEIRLHKITPTWLDNLTTPLIATLLTGFVTFILVGPVLRGAGDMLSEGITWLYNSLGALGGAIFGFFYAPITMTGMHHSFIAIETQLLAAKVTTGGSFIFTTAAMSNVAQGGAVLAVILVSRNQKMKSLCGAAGVSALLGITEPAMFGVNLKLRYPFIAAMIASGVASAWIAFQHVLAVALGAAGLPGFISVDPSNWLNFAIGLCLAFSISFALTIVFGKRQSAKEAAETTTKVVEKQAIISERTPLPIQVFAPMDGEIAPITEASDPTFASKAMGDGFLIRPSDDTIYAPFDATIEFVFPSKHAIGLCTKDGIQILLHCGIDTVNLQGEGFTCFVNDKQLVKAGDKLLHFDKIAMEEKGYNLETLVIFTKIPEGKQLQDLKSGVFHHTSTVLTIQ